jgi:hypothetical protein
MFWTTALGEPLDEPACPTPYPTAAGTTSTATVARVASIRRRPRACRRDTRLEVSVAACAASKCAAESFSACSKSFIVVLLIRTALATMADNT